MNVERLRNLVKAVREADPKYFDMSRIMHECGTPGCAFGHYASRIDLQDEFFLLPKLPHPDQVWKGVVDKNGASVEFNWTPVQKHFDLPQEDLNELFDADGCGDAKSPHEAAEYVENFIRRKALDEMVSESQAMGLYGK